MALACTLFNFFVYDLNIGTEVQLTEFSGPLPLQGALIACEVSWKVYFLALKPSLLSPARERALCVCRFVERHEHFEVVFVRALSETDGAVSSVRGMEHFPGNVVARVRGCHEVHVASCGATAGLLAEQGKVTNFTLLRGK